MRVGAVAAEIAAIVLHGVAEIAAPAWIATPIGVVRIRNTVLAVHLILGTVRNGNRGRLAGAPAVAVVATAGARPAAVTRRLTAIRRSIVVVAAAASVLIAEAI